MRRPTISAMTSLSRRRAQVSTTTTILPTATAGTSTSTANTSEHNQKQHMETTCPIVNQKFTPREILQQVRREFLRHRFSYTNHRAFENRWRHILQTLSVFGHVSHGNKVIPYRETGDAYKAMWEAVDDAKSSVLWQTYICKDDVVGKKTVDKLQAAHNRGVTTELLYDCGGNITGRTRLTESLRRLGATVIRHRPFFAHMWKYFASGGQWEHSPALRNHRKILLVDDKVAFTGGLNIGDDYCGKECGGNGRFRDTHCQVVGPAVQDLKWAYEDTKVPRPWRFSFARWKRIVKDAVSRGRSKKSSASLALQSNVKELWSFARMLQLHAHEQHQYHVRQQALHVSVDPLLSPVGDTTTRAGGNKSEAVGSGSGKRVKRRLRWFRQQLQQQRRNMMMAGGTSSVEGNAATTNDNEANGTLGSRLLNRWDTFREMATAAVETGKQQHHLRQATKFTLEAPLLDTEPVPEAIGVHSSIQPTTQVLQSNPHTRDWSLQIALWHVTRSAHRRVWITTPYYMPHRKLTQAILTAANRGIDIRIMAGSQTTTDPWFMWYASHYLTERFLKAGVQVYEYDGGQIMHAKTVVVDSVWSSVGSYNWDCMSNKNMEVCVTQFDVGTAREMEAQFLKDVSLAKKVTLLTLAKRPWWKRAFSWFSYHAVLVAEKLTFLTYRDSDLSSKLD